MAGPEDHHRLDRNTMATNQGMDRQQPLNTGSSMNSLKPQPLRQIRDYCQEHPDEEVSYFCFQCKVAPICSECVIHGDHQGHNVVLLKKAYPQIVKTIEELQIQISSKCDELAL
jgi:hypothetical protein